MELLKECFKKVIIPKTVYSEIKKKDNEEAISLAAKYKALLLMDDDIGRGYASILGVEVHGTLFVILLAFLRILLVRKKQ